MPNQKEYRFSFRAPSSLAPRARVLVYYVRNTNAEIVADSVTFDVEGLFRTSVSMNILLLMIIILGSWESSVIF